MYTKLDSEFFNLECLLEGLKIKFSNYTKLEVSQCSSDRKFLKKQSNRICRICLGAKLTYFLIKTRIVELLPGFFATSQFPAEKVSQVSGRKFACINCLQLYDSWPLFSNEGVPYFSENTSNQPVTKNCQSSTTAWPIIWKLQAA